MRLRRRTLQISFSVICLASTTNAATTATTPEARYAQATAYTNNTIYFLGGILSDTSLSTDFFSLDLSQQFNSSSPPWDLLPPLPAAISDASAAIGADGRVYLLGGQTWDCSSDFLNVYDTSTSSWGNPQFFGTEPLRRQDAGVFTSTDNEVIYYFGGESTSCSAGQATEYNSLNALSLANSSWFIPSDPQPPIAESGFALTMVKTSTGQEQVLIIGGQTTQDTLVQMSQVGLFDLETQTWSYVIATTLAGESTPQERIGHSAVTRSDGTVIVYGGTVGSNSRASEPQLAILNTSSNPLQWSSPTVGGNLSLAPEAGLTGHSAIMASGDVMILAFGEDGNGDFNEQIYFLDTQKMEWFDTYIPTTTSTAPHTSTSTTAPTTSSNNLPNSPTSTMTNPAPTTSTIAQQSSSSNTTTIAVATSIPLSIIALASAITTIFFYRRRRNHGTSQDPPGTRSSSNYSYERTYISPSAKYLNDPSPSRFKRLFPTRKEHASPPPSRPPPQPQQLGVYLPSWAARHAESNKSASANGEDDGDDVGTLGLEDRMVQVASMSFVAPRMQLRVLNPDPESVSSMEDLALGDEGGVRRRVSGGQLV